MPRLSSSRYIPLKTTGTGEIVKRHAKAGVTVPSFDIITLGNGTNYAGSGHTIRWSRGRREKRCFVSRFSAQQHGLGEVCLSEPSTQEAYGTSDWDIILGHWGLNPGVQLDTPQIPLPSFNLLPCADERFPNHGNSTGHRETGSTIE